MEHCGALLRALIRAEYCGSFLAAVDAYVVLEGSVSEVEVIQLTANVSFLLALLHLLCPQSTIDVNELVHLVWYQPTSD